MKIVGVDTGGTFTDCVVLETDGVISHAKSSSTPPVFENGVMAVVGTALGSDPNWMDLGSLERFMHGFTVGLNRLATHTGARVGLITTGGHEDSILIGRVQQKVKGLGQDEITHAAKLMKPTPLVPRPRIVGLNERVNWRGDVLIPVDKRGAEEAVRLLVSLGVEAIAISFLWSFMNPAHEDLVAGVVAGLAPDVFVTRASRLSPALGEYERTITAVINAYIGPASAEYIEKIESLLRERSLIAPFFVMQSSGGVTSASQAKERAVHVISSGPTGGVIGAGIVGRELDYRNIITTDVGGTSFDVGLVVGGDVIMTPSPVYGQFEIRVPTVDVRSIGAGGGSVAHIDALAGTIQVGPQSAGADPGPACYGKGGACPTVTDADVVLGRIAAEDFLGVGLEVLPELANDAIRVHIAEPLQLSVEEAALGIAQIVDSKMADLVRKVTIERGYDPQDFVLFAYGGGGPTHVGGYAPEAGIPTAVVSPYSSVFSAVGIALADVIQLQEQSEVMDLPVDVQKLANAYEALERRAKSELGSSITLTRSARLKLKYQVHEVEVPMPAGRILDETVAQLLYDFIDRYEQLFGKGTAYTQAGVEIVGLRLQARASLPTPPIPTYPRGDGDIDRALRGARRVTFDHRASKQDVPVYDAPELQPGDDLPGPAIVLLRGSTMVLHPGQRVIVDDYLNLVISFEQAL